MIDLYVYYKVRDENAAPLEALVRAMQAGLAPVAGEPAQLKRRPDAKDGMHTWMEVYPAVDAGFAAKLDAAATAAGLAALIEGPRRSEVFTDLTPCA